ncbi:MAG: GntR family transcriptional regulator [Pseudolabrys sp.]|nr:GntR family transcriptional regulator [Pseudolabrys sp.]
MTMLLSDRVYTKIKTMILTGKVVDLSERTLAAELSVSRVPVREAIKVLEREGLLIVVPRSGIVVRRLRIDEVRELYEVRQAIEGMAAFLAAGARRSEMAGVRQRLEALDTGKDFDHAAIQRENAVFHRTLFEICGNSQLSAIYASIEPKIALNFRLTAVHAPERVERALRYHINIAKAIEAGDGAKAESLMRKNLDDGKAARIEILTRLQANEAVPAAKISKPAAARRTAPISKAKGARK